MALLNKLYVRVALLIAVVALVISVVTATVSYFFNLQQQRELNTQLVEQLANSARNTAAIAAYIGDQDLAQEIVNGLVAVDMVGGAKLDMQMGAPVMQGLMGDDSNQVVVNLENPFAQDESVGTLVVFPNVAFIQQRAQSIGQQSAWVLLMLSAVTSIAVSLVVRRSLTNPIKRLTKGFSKVDPNIIDSMQPIDIGYRRRNEIGRLVGGINALMIALKQNLQTERILRERTQALEQRFRIIFEQASAGIGLVDADNKIMMLNPAMQHLFGQIDVNDDFSTLFIESSHVKEALENMRSNNIEQISMDLEFWRNSEKYFVHCLFAKVSEQRVKKREKQAPLIEVIMNDISERIQREQSTRFEADHDSLTHWRNRRSGERLLTDLLARCHLHEHTFVLMMIDLDRFKAVNDTHGHDAGDDVLVAVTKRLMECVTSIDHVVNVRWGGDEFVIGFVLEDADIDSIDTLCVSMLDALRAPIKVSDDIICQIGGSIGVITSTNNQQRIESLLIKADETMYKVKQQGRDNFLITS